jgi:hypothetical protein
LTERAAALAHVENAHRSVRGSGPGTRAATQQINQADAVQLSAQFQAFCRDLHSECCDFLVMPVTDLDLREVLRENLLFGRRMDRGNPNPRRVGACLRRGVAGLFTNAPRKQTLVNRRNRMNPLLQIPGQTPGRFRVGERVRIKHGFKVMIAEVVEDRGTIGVGGRRLYGVKVRVDPWNELTT